MKEEGTGMWDKLAQPLPAEHRNVLTLTCLDALCTATTTFHLTHHLHAFYHPPTTMIKVNPPPLLKTLLNSHGPPSNLVRYGV